MKEGLKEEGFEGVGGKEREWKGWMEGEKEGVREMGEGEEFEMMRVGGGGSDMEVGE